MHTKNLNTNPKAVTALLLRWQQGDAQALDDLIAVVYQELHRLAMGQIRRETNPQLQPTELVAEAYLRLVEADQIQLINRQHFFSIAARTMRRVLVDHFRKRQSKKRGEGQTLITFQAEKVGDSQQMVPLDDLDDALSRLEDLDKRQADIVELKFFGGLTGEEIGNVLEISARTVKREWAAARLWLHQAMAQSSPSA